MSTGNNSTMTPGKRFLILIKPDKEEIRNVYIYSIFAGFIMLSLPLGIQAIINLIQGGQISTSWVVLILFVILGLVLSGILQVAQLRITENLQQKIFTRAAFDFAYRTSRIKLEELYNKYAPELMNRFFDVISIQKGLTKLLIDFSTASIQTVFGLLLLSLYHPFFIVFSLILIILVLFIFKLTYKKGLETSLKESKSKYNVAHWLQELARTNISFKLAGITDLPLNKVDKLTGEYVEAREMHFKVLVQQYILLIVFKVFVASGLLIVGSLLVINQQMNIGQFVAAEIIILMILSSVEKLILSLETVYDLLTSIEKVGQVTDLELESESGINILSHLDENQGGMEVELNQVTFHYPGSNKSILDKVSMHLKPSERVMISGEVDSGKTTLLFVLAGLYKVQQGNVVLNKMPVNNLNPNFLRSIIGDCLMDELLFEGTLLENITMGRENAAFENVQWAVENLGLSDFIYSLPNGFDTKIFPQGKQFSKGIVDKIILARSIVDRPRLLLIKDTFSSFAEDEGRLIIDFLTHKDNPWTLVVVSKDVRLIPKVDRVFTMSNGILIETIEK